MNLSDAYQQLQSKVKGEILLPGGLDYEERRNIWNSRLVKQPAMVICCTCASDVAATVKHCAEEELEFSVKSGGHSFAGNGISAGQPMIDLSGMKDIEIDTKNHTALVGPGVRWGEIYKRVTELGLAIAGGTVSTVGVTGYTLGGGTGNLARRFGLGLDNLLSVEVVTADGEIRTASEKENPDLFWALRGGSGNFGIVTRLEFRLHKINLNMLAGQVIYPLKEAEKALHVFRDVMANAPDEFNCYPCMIQIPPIPEFPEKWHGQVALDFFICHAGEQATGIKVAEPLRTVAKPIMDSVGPSTFLDVHQAMDAGCPDGQRWYSQGHYMDALTDDAIKVFIRNSSRMKGAYTFIYFEPLGGAISRVAPDATAFAHRKASLGFHVLAGWSDSEEDAPIRKWARTFREEMAACSESGVYVNALSEDEVDRVKSAYGDNYQRLVELKRKWDPDNIFRRNHNIAPS